MIEVKTYDTEGNVADAIHVEVAWFGSHVRAGVLRDAMIMYQANKRQGTASVKTRREVQGSTRKLYRQKGTGRARVGDGRAPNRRGGGSVFGPKPRDYSYSLPKKALKVALDSALLAKLSDGEVMVADCPVGEAPKTGPVSAYFSKIGIEKGVRCLYVISGHDAVFHKSARNIPGLSVLPLTDINAYEVVRPPHVVFSREAFEKLLEGRR